MRSDKSRLCAGKNPRFSLLEVLYNARFNNVMARNHVSTVLPDVDTIVFFIQVCAVGSLITYCHSVNMEEGFPHKAWVCQIVSHFLTFFWLIHNCLLISYDSTEQFSIERKNTSTQKFFQNSNFMLYTPHVTFVFVVLISSSNQWLMKNS